jgi:hypothetical protein
MFCWIVCLRYVIDFMLADRVPLTRMPDYGDIQSRDPEDRVPNTTVGIGRAMLSNRLSHFLDVKGPR